MSALWLMGLGGSVTYLLMKKRAVEDKLAESVREWEGTQKEATDGATMKEVRKVWRDRDEDVEFDERLPAADRKKIMAQASAAEAQTRVLDEPRVTIQGVYLDGYVS